MITPWQIYLIGQLDYWRNGLCMFGHVFLLVIAALSYLIAAMPRDMTVAPAFGRARWGMSIAAACLLCIAGLLPGSRTVAAMWLLPKIVNNETIQQDVGDTYKLALEFIQAKLRQPEKTEGAE